MRSKVGFHQSSSALKYNKCEILECFKGYDIFLEFFFSMNVDFGTLGHNCVMQHFYLNNTNAFAYFRALH